MARLCNGTTDYIDVGSQSALQPAAITISCWVNVVAWADYRSFVNLNKTGGGTSRYYIGTTATVHKLSYYFVGSSVFVDPGSATLTAGVLYHVLATYTSAGSAGLATFVNGVSDGTSGSAAALGTSTENTSFGAAVTSGSPVASSYANVKLADVAIWNVVLSAAEIGALVKGVRPPQIRRASLVGFWPLDGIQSPEPDLSGNKFNGTLTGTALATGPPIALSTRRVFFLSAAAAANPFAKYDWPQSTLPPPDRSFVQAIDLSALAGAGAKPFAKQDWPLTLLPPPDRSYVQGIDLSPLAGAGAKPFAKNDWPGTLLPPPDRSYMEATDLSRLGGAGAKPFAKYDWPLSVLPIQPTRSFVWPSDIVAYLAKFPFAKYDWPLTQLAPPDRSYVQSSNLSALALAGAKPFAKYDWPLDVLPVLNPPGFVQSIDLSPLATAGTKPFAKNDWPQSILPVLPDRSFVYDIHLSFMAGAGAKPFAKQDWPLSVLPVLNPPGFMQAVDLSALANAGLVPFAKYDWPLSVPPVLNPPGYIWSTSGPLIPQLGFGRRRALFIVSASGFPASYWPDGS